MGIQRDVEDFHRLCGSSIGDFRTPAFCDVEMRLDLIDEEVRELKKACAKSDLAAAVDALIDIIYVTVGAGVSWGINLRAYWAEVQRSNMAKAPDGVVRRREDGKILKPEGWTPPDIEFLLRHQRRIFNERGETCFVDAEEPEAVTRVELDAMQERLKRAHDALEEVNQIRRETERDGGMSGNTADRIGTVCLRTLLED